MAKKVLRNRKQFNSTVNPDLLDAIRQISDQTDIPISKLVDKAIELLIEDMKNKGLYNN